MNAFIFAALAVVGLVLIVCGLVFTYNQDRFSGPGILAGAGCAGLGSLLMMLAGLFAGRVLP